MRPSSRGLLLEAEQPSPVSAAVTTTVGRAQVSAVNLEAETIFAFCHPSVSYLSTFLTESLTWHGAGVVGVDGRYVQEGDSNLEHRWAAEDVGRALHEVVPSDRTLVLVGHSGGAPLAGLVQARYQLAHAMIFLAPHPSRAELLRRWIDPAVGSDGRRNPELDLYAADRPFPLLPEWVERYRAAQQRRLLATAEVAARALREGEPERRLDLPCLFADPRFRDRQLDPNQRNSLPLGVDPALTNQRRGFLADGTTARTFFDQWYLPTTTANLLTLAPWLTVPVLSVAFGADPLIFPSETLEVAQALPRGSTVWTLENAIHHPGDQKDHLDALSRKMLAWLSHLD